MSWEPRKLDDLGSVGRGKSRHRPRNDPSLYGGPYPFFQTGDVKAADLFMTEYSQTYNEDGLAQSKLWQPGTLCITIAANIAETAILGIPGCFPDSVVGFVSDPQRSDVKFVKYYIDLIKLQMQNISRGTTQDNLSLDKLLTFDFLTPTVTLQKRIAGILSAYDELIGNNRRRIRILEEAAQELYREWFAKFRFPGHEREELIQSPLGRFPKSWQLRPTSVCVEINPKVAVSRGVEHPFVPMGCLECDSMVVSGIETRKGNSGSKFQNGDTLFARITPCLENGKTGFVQFLSNGEAVACGSTEFIVLRSRTLSPEYVYLMARSKEFRGNAIKSMSGATGRQRVQEECFENFIIPQPPAPILEQFSFIVRPSFRLIHGLNLQNQNLRKTRDLLLPRLLSGELEVPLEIGS